MQEYNINNFCYKRYLSAIGVQAGFLRTALPDPSSEVPRIKDIRALLRLIDLYGYSHEIEPLKTRG